MYNIAVCVSTLVPLLEVTPNNNISWTIVSIAVLPCLVTGIITYLIHLSNKRSEERKQLNSLFVTAAIENWKQGMAYAKTVKGTKLRISPLDSFIVNMLKLSEVLQKEKITKENVIQKMKEIDEINDKLKIYYEEKKLKADEVDKEEKN